MRASCSNNKDAKDFHAWESNLKKVEVKLKYLIAYLKNYNSNALEGSLDVDPFLEPSLVDWWEHKEADCSFHNL